MKIDKHIKNGPYYSAGIDCRWEEEYGTHGIGLSASKIGFWRKVKKENLTIKVGDVKYRAKFSQLMNFHKNHPGSRGYARSTLLYYFPLSIMEETGMKKLTVPVEPQLNLFS